MATLAEVEIYVRDNGHLNEVPSSEEIKKNGGHELGEMDKLLLKKVEELTLYLIEQNREMKNQNEIIIKQNENIQTQNKIISKQNERIKKIEDEIMLFKDKKR